MTQHKSLWSVSLSNGETLHEEKGSYKTIAGELSPWQRLLKYLSDNSLSITSLSIYTEDGRRFTLPSIGNDRRSPKFHAFASAAKPTNLNMFRKVGQDMTRDGKVISQDLYTVIEAEYLDGKILQTWVNNETLNSWTLLTTKTNL